MKQGEHAQLEECSTVGYTTPTYSISVRSSCNFAIFKSLVEGEGKPGLDTACIKEVRKPPLPIKSIEKMIPRLSLEKEIFSLFYPSDSNRETCFGIIIGPSGTGKTMVERDF